MDGTQIIKNFYAALDAGNVEQASQYLSDEYLLLDFVQKPLDKTSMLEMWKVFRIAMPNFKHTLSNVRKEENMVHATIQSSGTNTGNLDLRKFGFGLISPTRKFIIFHNSYCEFSIIDDMIISERDVSPKSPNRRMSGMLKEFNIHTLPY